MAQLNNIQLFKEDDTTVSATDGTNFYAPIIRGFRKEIPNPSGQHTYLTIDLEQNTTNDTAKYHAVVVEGKIIDDGTSGGYISNVFGRHFKHVASTIFNPDFTESVIGEFDTLQYASDMDIDYTSTLAFDYYQSVDILESLNIAGNPINLSNGVLDFNLKINADTINAVIMGIYYLI